eukprot:scaffold3111_cov332-Prasinococcus_capsulatus_cf.AAC.12
MAPRDCARGSQTPLAWAGEATVTLGNVRRLDRCCRGRLGRRRERSRGHLLLCQRARSPMVNVDLCLLSRGPASCGCEGHLGISLNGPMARWARPPRGAPGRAGGM